METGDFDEDDSYHDEDDSDHGEDAPDDSDHGEDDSDHVFSGHTDSVFSVDCSPRDVGLVATGGGDDIAFIWKIGDATSPIELKGHSDSVAALKFSTDGQLLASGGLDGVVNVWESLTGNLKHKLEGPSDSIEWVKWHPRGHLILAGSEDFCGWLWNADNGVCLNVLSGHSGPVTCGDFTPDGKWICTGAADGSLRLWNPKSGESTRVVQGHAYHREGLTSLAIHPDSIVAITGSTDTNACIVNLQSGKVSGSLIGHSKSVECIAFSSGLPLAATGGMDGNLIIWDLQTLSQRSTSEHEDAVVKLLWASSLHLIYTGCLDGNVRIWDSRTGSCVKIFQGHEDSILDMAVTPDGKYILSGSDDGTARAFAIQ